MEILENSQEMDGVEIQPSPPMQLRLGSLKTSKQTFARILKAFATGKLGEKKYRALIWGMGLYISYLKAEAEMELEKRIEALEERIGGNQ